jgi:hypothetical protein
MCRERGWRGPIGAAGGVRLAVSLLQAHHRFIKALFLLCRFPPMAARCLHQSASLTNSSRVSASSLHHLIEGCQIPLHLPQSLPLGSGDSRRRLCATGHSLETMRCKAVHSFEGSRLALELQKATANTPAWSKLAWPNPLARVRHAHRLLSVPLRYQICLSRATNDKRVVP